MAQFKKIGKLINPTDNITYKYVRMINDPNTHLFKEKLRMTDWLQTTQYEDAEQCYDEFHEILHSHFESCFPVKKIKINKMKPRPTWNNAEIKDIKHKLEAAEIIMGVKKDENSTELYKHLKNAFK
ncbi:hypothetical protein HHI36_009274 [Cryptolaemus montrouzieri]|uniref:Uncharacterized protein n=1 Tax=Cryptolaemus montrouzieri TaxID=559131 RepID=A0ABD2MUV6_9CUCU